ncbi:TetR/AcrR family transcriptional regulator [Phytohabitans sp. ZYX-F-186]|uniref:TetR/AcrR family transcriptional regulator n=1 Tax=Phytohabitans maris TaxID=3071409 RepID=A0ABU0Z9T8_9ACTN|nr:TetR/AcrR family transcriptional regulator [Phytohabitans sp. ZYX-F-186]MDQ7903758.1 TetR/AcrR family transcriptional regulator [Phytohabitans sp. ZYX-F-186]
MAREPVDRRERILASSAKLFARNGVAATTVRQIADEVGILSGSLYHHFDSKEAIVDEVVSSFLTDLRTRYEKVLASDLDARARLHDLVVASLEAVEAHPHATEIYQNDVNYLSQLDRFAYLRKAGRDVQNAWLQVIQAGIDAGAFRSDIDPKILYRLMRDALWMSVRWFKPTREYPRARLAEDCTSIFLDGLTQAPR